MKIQNIICLEQDSYILIILGLQPRSISFKMKY